MPPDRKPQARTPKRFSLELAVLAQWAIVLLMGSLYLIARSTGDDRIGFFGVLLVPVGVASIVVLVNAVDRNPRLSGFRRWAWIYAVVGLLPVGGTLYWARHGSSSRGATTGSTETATSASAGSGATAPLMEKLGKGVAFWNAAVLTLLLLIALVGLVVIFVAR